MPQPEAATSETTIDRYEVERRVSGISYVKRDGQHIGTFYHESDARSFVAGEKAIELINRARIYVACASVVTFPNTSETASLMAEIDSALSQLPSDDKAGTP